MKLYKCKDAIIGEGVEAIRILRDGKGDELICVKSGDESFEKRNKKAKECSQKDADKFLAKNKQLIRVPKRAELRKKAPLSHEDLDKEIEDQKTKTRDIRKHEEENEKGEKIQKLTFFEDIEVKSLDDFWTAQAAQKEEPEPEEIEEEIEPAEV